MIATEKLVQLVSVTGTFLSHDGLQMTPSSNLRRFVVTAVIMAIVSPWLVMATQRTFASMFNDPGGWVPDSVDYKRDAVWFKNSFRGHEMVLVSFPECTIDNPNFELFVETLMRPADPRMGKRNRELIHYATSGPEMLSR